MLIIKNLCASVGDKEVVKNVSLSIKSGEIHVLMGPNGSGKTSLAMALAGAPAYQASDTSIIAIETMNIVNMKSNERAKAGLFVSFQQPVGVEGVTVEQMLRTAIGKWQLVNGKQKSKGVDVLQFRKELETIAEKLGIKKELLYRSVNVGFSGGEKKKIEMLQMMMLKPKYAILDEIDSGVDVDAMAKVMQSLKRQIATSRTPRNDSGTGILLITHNPRIFKHVTPNFVHVMKNGQLVKSGGKELIKQIEKEGYEGIK